MPQDDIGAVPCALLGVAGVHGLHRHAREFADEHDGRVGPLLCAIVRSPTGVSSFGSNGPSRMVPTKRVDVADAVSAVVKDRLKEFEKSPAFRPDLSGADLSHGTWTGRICHHSGSRAPRWQG